ncbi:Uncharacterised protein [Escherichia coli]|uniref:Uncharacterized protein n=1 Tax=Escherichia coli TaxID=562 RepID=A0A377CX74_ECOLX|nr:Uncharacterised protein [Escherichia coli]
MGTNNVNARVQSIACFAYGWTSPGTNLGAGYTPPYFAEECRRQCLLRHTLTAPTLLYSSSWMKP